MGYSQTVPYAQLDCYTDRKDTVVINTTANPKTIRDITLPVYTRPLSYAFVDIIAYRYADTSGGDNQVLGTPYIGITDSGGTLQNAGDIISGSLYRLQASEVVHCQNICYGNTDIKQYLTSGCTRTIKFGNIRSSFDNLEVNELLGRVRLYFL